MKISLDALIVLDAIDRYGSFAAAAQQLYRVPSAITYTVRKLERDLGIALFDRSGHKPVFTEAGLALLRDGRDLLQAAQRLQARSQRIATGWEVTLSLAVEQLLPNRILLQLFDRFYELNRATQLRLSHEILGGSWDALHTGRADLVVGASGDRPPGGGYTTRWPGRRDRSATPSSRLTGWLPLPTRPRSSSRGRSASWTARKS